MSMYDEIEIEDMTYDSTLQIYHYPCPCGDRFEIGIADLRDGEDVAVCPSCSLMIRVVFEVVSSWCLRRGVGGLNGGCGRMPGDEEIGGCRFCAYADWILG